MKLWVKIALACTGVLILIVCICSALLLAQTNKSIMVQMRQSTKAQLGNLCESVSSMVIYYGAASLTPIAKRALIKDSFSRFADEYYVLISETEVLYSKVRIEPEKLASSELYYEGSADGSEVLIHGKKVDLLGDSYTIYIVKDLSDTIAAMNRLVWEFVLISIGCIMLGVLGIILLTRLSTKPLKKLREATGCIAHGNYGIRADVLSKDEVGDLARDFNGMANAIQMHVAELQETAARQRLFIGDLTHEFKTPMTSVLMYSETLLNTKLPKEDSQQALSHIHEQCKWLEQLTQKLL